MVYSDGTVSDEEIAYQLANIDATKSPAIIAALATLSVLATIAIVLRFIVRWNTKAQYRLDDWTILGAYLLSWGSFSVIYFETKFGLGQHSVAITPEKSVRLYQSFIFEGPNFFTGVMLTQISMLFLYKRVFTTSTIWFRNTLYIISFLSISVWISCIPPAIFACTPFAFTWDKTIDGTCFEVRNVYISQTLFTLLLDIAIVAAPMKMVWNLHTNFGTKVAVTGLFLLGSFVCVINLIKLPYLIKTPGPDPLWDDTPASIWTHAEFTLGIVSACLPCFRPLFKSIHGVFSSAKSSSNQSSGATVISGRASHPRSNNNNNNNNRPNSYRTLNGGSGNEGRSKKEIDSNEEDNGSSIALVPSSGKGWSRTSHHVVEVTGGFGGGGGGTNNPEKDVEKGEKLQQASKGGEIIGVKRDIRVSSHQMARR